MFTETVERISALVLKQLQATLAAGHALSMVRVKQTSQSVCTYACHCLPLQCCSLLQVLLVGGFARSPYMHAQLQAALPRGTKLVVPPLPHAAILTGKCARFVPVLSGL
jgi:hypothetical protein